MPITDKQREQRKNHIGASDVPALFGLDPFRNAHDVFLEKTGKLQDNGAETQAMQRGQYMETAIVNWFVGITGALVTRNQFRSAKSQGIPLGSNCDAIVNETGLPVEAKSQGAYSNEVWGESGTDEVPDRIILQTHAQMICTSTENCFVPTYLAFREFQLFQIALNEDIKDQIIERVCNFWEKNVQADTPPPIIPSLDVIKRVRRQPGKTTAIDLALIEAYEESSQFVKEATARKKEAQAAILAALGDAEAATAGDRFVTNYEQNRKGYEVKPTSFRVLRFPKNL